MDAKRAVATDRPPDHVGERLDVAPHVLVKRITLAAATTLAAVNIWTGAPLLAVWIGARLQGGTQPSMTGALAAVVALVIFETALGFCLSWLSSTYDRVTGRPAEARQTSPWLRSMRGEREQQARERHGVSLIERIVALSVAAGAISFEVWFFFFAGSPI
jgi:hypothetical protein